ncbi:LacI family DNA-binding transcriptional regulator [Paenibacillus sp. strain BS8-2]
MVTIKDIAKQAGVSFSTVSKALLDNPNIKTVTKERIWEIAREMGYQPNIAARSLVSKKSGAIGIIWPTVERGALSALITKLNEELERRGYTTLFSISRTEAAIESFNRFRMDAVLLFGDRDGNQAELSEIGRVQSPLLVYGAAGTHPFSTVDVNRGHAIRLAVRHLTKLGHRAIAYIGEPAGNDPMQAVKVAAFLDEAKALGLEADERSVLRMEGLETHDGYIAAIEMFGWPTPPTAVISGGVDLTRGIYRAARERDISVPEALSVVSYDNLPLMEDLDVPTTAVGVSVGDIASIIAEALHTLIEAPDETQTIELEPEIIIRGSSSEHVSS